jgi:hypothetical protein
MKKLLILSVLFVSASLFAESGRTRANKRPPAPLVQAQELTMEEIIKRVNEPEKQEPAKQKLSGVTQIVQANYKSEIEGLFLGSVVGFGYGNYYAEGDNSFTYAWLGTDVLLIGLTVLLGMSQDTPAVLRSLPLFVLGASRIAQGLYGMAAVREYNYSLQKDNRLVLSYAVDF